MQQTAREKFLIFRIRRYKDEEAFNELLQAHSGKIVRWLNFKLPTVQDVEDAYSEVCLRTWNYLTTSESYSFVGLLFNTGRFVVAEFYRQRPPTVHLVEEAGWVEELTHHDQGQSIVSQIDAGFLREALKQLSEPHQEVLILRFLEDMRLKEMAEILGINEVAVRVRVHRALKAFRDLLEKNHQIL